MGRFKDINIFFEQYWVNLKTFLFFKKEKVIFQVRKIIL